MHTVDGSPGHREPLWGSCCSCVCRRHQPETLSILLALPTSRVFASPLWAGRKERKRKEKHAPKSKISLLLQIQCCLPCAKRHVKINNEGQNGLWTCSPCVPIKQETLFSSVMIQKAHLWRLSNVQAQTCRLAPLQQQKGGDWIWPMRSAFPHNRAVAWQCAAMRK